MKAKIITIGDEILIGQIIDTNSSFIAKELDNIGIQTIEMLSISDTREHIFQTLQNVQNTVELVIITGGLGPTKDDITKQVFLEYFEDNYIRNIAVEEHIRALFSKMNFTISQVNLDQALVPSKATVLNNNYGTAPGLWMKKQNTIFVSMPGVPYEMKGIVKEQLIPKLINEFNRPIIIHKTILTYGQGESIIAHRIANWEENLPNFIKLAYLPSPGRVRLRLTARGTDREFLQKNIDIQVKELDNLIHDIIVGFEESETIEIIVAQKLLKSKFTLSVAESCTGGKISQTLTKIPGASDFFISGIVSYATRMKTELLQVSQELIKDHSVVSKEVALAMVKGVKKLTQSDFAIATTGNAGPSKGDSPADLGTVFIAIATPEKVFCEEFNFGQPREKVIDRAVNKALELLLKEIQKN